MVDEDERLPEQGDEQRPSLELEAPPIGRSRGRASPEPPRRRSTSAPQSARSHAPASNCLRTTPRGSRIHTVGTGRRGSRTPRA